MTATTQGLTAAEVEERVRRGQVNRVRRSDAAEYRAIVARNVLTVFNRELGANFEVEAFSHVALWNSENEWIEMRLKARESMLVRVAELGLTVPFARGEEIRTEVSAKFRPDGVRKELRATGFEITRWWTDPDDRYALSLAEAV